MQPWSKVSKMAPDAIKTMQDSLLVSMIKNEVYAGHPYYSRIFKDLKIEPDDIRQTDDLTKLPFTSKIDVMPTEEDRMRPKQFVLERTADGKPDEKKKGFLGKLFKKKEAEDDVDQYRLLQLFYTGGRTGKMVPMVYTPYDISNLKEIGMRSFDMWGITRDDSTINALSYAPHMSFWQIFYSTINTGATALQSGGGRVLGMEKILKALHNLEAPVLITFPGYADHCLQVLERFGFPMPTLEKIVLGMDDAPSSMVERIKEGLGKVNAKDNQVFRSYFLSEAKGGWPECLPGFGYHINPDHVFVEVIDSETGERKGECEPGEIVVTNIDARGTVFLRYRSGDLTTGGITYEPCPNCGRTVPRILGEIERRGNFFEINNGDGKKIFNFNKLRRHLFGINNLSQWYAEIKDSGGGDRLNLVVCSRPNVQEAELKKELEKGIQEAEVDFPYDINFSTLENIIQRQGMEKNLTECRIFDERNG